MEAWLSILPLFFPLYLVKLDIFGVPSNVQEVIVMITFLIWGVFSLVRWVDLWPKLEDKAFWIRQWWFSNRKFVVFSCLFLLISAVAVLIVPQSTTLIDGKTIYESKKVALGIFKGWIVIPYLYFWMLWFSVRQKDFLFKSIYAYVFSALPLVIWAVFQYLTGSFITADGRASGPFINANYLAMYLAPAVVALWIMIVRGILMGFRLPRFLIGAFLAVLYTISLLMTQSYGAMLAIIVTLSVFMIATARIHLQFKKQFELDLIKKIGFFLLTILLVVLLSAGLLFVKTEKWKLFTEFQARSSSSVRLEVYQIAGEMIRQHPLLGIGFGQFEPLYNLKAPEILGHAPYEWVMIHTHDTFLAVWLNLGIAGLLMFIGLIAVVFTKYWKTYDYEQKFYRLIGVSMLLVMLLHGLVDTYLFKNDLAMLFWLVIAICLLPRNFVIEGMVVDGLKVGRKLGMPTANLRIRKTNRKMEDLAYGVYGALVYFQGNRYLGAVSYGVRPTVEDTDIPTLEVHIIGFSQEIYGEELRLELVSWIRSVFKFKDLEELKANQKNDLKLIQSKIKI
jgi:O-antigen ligase